MLFYHDKRVNAVILVSHKEICEGFEKFVFESGYVKISSSSSLWATIGFPALCVLNCIYGSFYSRKTSKQKCILVLVKTHLFMLDCVKDNHVNMKTAGLKE